MKDLQRRPLNYTQRMLLFASEQRSIYRPVRRPLAEGDQDFEKLDQNLKFPQIVKKGERGGNLYELVLYDEKCTCMSTFLKKKSRFLGLIFAKFDQILASFR